jgi:hypothetical protein
MRSYRACDLLHMFSIFTSRESTERREADPVCNRQQSVPTERSEER